MKMRADFFFFSSKMHLQVFKNHLTIQSSQQVKNFFEKVLLSPVISHSISWQLPNSASIPLLLPWRLVAN